MSIRFWIWSLILGIYTEGVVAQRYAAFNYTQQEGMPTTEWVDMVADSKGDLWLRQSLGFTVFDGRNTQAIDRKSGLKAASEYLIVADKSNKVWIIPEQVPMHELQVFKDRKLIKTLNLDSIVHTHTPQYNLQYDPFSDEILVLRGATLWACAAQDPMYRFRPKIVIKPINGQAILRTGGLTLDKFRHRLFVAVLTKDSLRYALEIVDTLQKVLPKNRFQPNLGDIAGGLPNGDIIVNFGTVFYRCINHKTWQPISLDNPDAKPSGATSQNALLFVRYIDKNTSVLTDFSAEYPNGKSFIFKSPPLGVPLSNKAIKDKDNTYWIATRGGLVHLFPYFFDCLDSQNPDMLSDIHAVCEDKNGKIWFGSYSGGMAYFDGTHIKTDAQQQKTMFLPSSFRDSEGNMWFNAQNKGSAQIFSLSHPAPFSPTPAFYFHKTYNNEIGIGFMEKGLGIAATETDFRAGKWRIIGKEKGLDLGNVITTVKDRFGFWWAGRPSTGIAIYDAKRDTAFTYPIKTSDDYGAGSSLMDTHGNLWFGTNRGLCFLDNSQPVNPKNFDPKKHFIPIRHDIIDTTMVSMLYQIDANTLIVGNKDRLFLVDLAVFYQSHYTHADVHPLSMRMGFLGLGVEQNGIFAARDSTFWIVSDAGIHRFDPRLFTWNHAKPTMKIDSLVAPSRSIAKPNNRLVKFNADDKTIKIYFNYVADSFDIAANLRFFYRLKNASNKDTTWIQADKNMIEYFNLSADTYTFEVYADKNGIQSDVQTIKFNIPLHFYENPLFGLLITGIILFIAYCIFREKNARKQKELELEQLKRIGTEQKLELEQQKREKTQLRVQAIVNQLNPHFLKNVMNILALKSYKDQEATNMIDKLSENITTVFKNSIDGKPYHTLREEIQLVSNYFYLQKVRFEDKFHYEMPPEDSFRDLENYKIFVMQLLIHAENAVEHGIRRQENGGWVHLMVADEGDTIKLTIEDNGVGRKKSKEKPSYSTQQGTKMLTDLQDIYNKHNAQFIKNQYDDAIFDTPEPHGTRVIIWIPKIYDYEAL